MSSTLPPVWGQRLLMRGPLSSPAPPPMPAGVALPLSQPKQSAQALQHPSPIQFAATQRKKVHLIHDVPYKNPDGTFNMVVEIPTGTNEKWETRKTDGQLFRARKQSKLRVIDFLSYPGNYGFIPQTLSPKRDGGDGDPVDVMLLAPSKPRGSIQKVRIIGALRLLDRGERDDKLLAVTANGPFKQIKDLPELMMKFPGAVEIVKTWFENYDGPGENFFQTYANRDDSIRLVEEGHTGWRDDPETPDSAKA